jgi:hypothetical protein
MRRSSAGLGLGTAAVLAVGIAVSHFSAREGQTAGPAAKTAPRTHQPRSAPAGPASDSDYRGNCSAYLAPPAAKPPDDGDANRSDAYEVVEKFFGAQHDGAKVETLAHMHYAIALTPDPRHTHLSPFFDRSIEAIQQAAQDDGYTYNSSWMPWAIERRD